MNDDHRWGRDRFAGHANAGVLGCKCGCQVARQDRRSAQGQARGHRRGSDIGEELPARKSFRVRHSYPVLLQTPDSAWGCDTMSRAATRCRAWAARFVEKRKHRLVPVRKRPWHAWLPVGYGVSVSIRHFHLRQRGLGEDFILLNYAVLVEQEGGERVHFVRLERAFQHEGHTAIDVVPDDRRVRRMQRHDTSRSNAWLKAWRRALQWRCGLDQHRSPPARTVRSVAHRAFLGENRRALLCRSLPRWKILPVGADGDILVPNLLGRRRL